MFIFLIFYFRQKIRQCRARLTITRPTLPSISRHSIRATVGVWIWVKYKRPFFSIRVRTFALFRSIPISYLESFEPIILVWKILWKGPIISFAKNISLKTFMWLKGELFRSLSCKREKRTCGSSTYVKSYRFSECWQYMLQNMWKSIVSIVGKMVSFASRRSECAWEEPELEDQLNTLTHFLF